MTKNGCAVFGEFISGNELLPHSDRSKIETLRIYDGTAPQDCQQSASAADINDQNIFVFRDEIVSQFILHGRDDELDFFCRVDDLHFKPRCDADPVYENICVRRFTDRSGRDDANMLHIVLGKELPETLQDLDPYAHGLCRKTAPPKRFLAEPDTAGQLFENFDPSVGI